MANRRADDGEFFTSGGTPSRFPGGEDKTLSPGEAARVARMGRIDEDYDVASSDEDWSSDPRGKEALKRVREKTNRYIDNADFGSSVG